MQRHEVVSSPSEELILVDENDQEIGTMSKDRCHVAPGTLHRAFSVFLFNAAGDVLLQQRAAGKPLWPLFWSNACCSHPRQGETLDIAVERRMQQELGVTADVDHVYKFTYQAPFGDIGAEHELCHVFIGQHEGPFDVNETEVAALRYFTQDELNAALEDQPDRFTPWFKMEWRELRDRFGDGNLASIRAQ